MFVALDFNVCTGGTAACIFSRTAHAMQNRIYLELCVYLFVLSAQPQSPVSLWLLRVISYENIDFIRCWISSIFRSHEIYVRPAPDLLPSSRIYFARGIYFNRYCFASPHDECEISASTRCVLHTIGTSIHIHSQHFYYVNGIFRRRRHTAATSGEV